MGLYAILSFQSVAVEHHCARRSVGYREDSGHFRSTYAYTFRYQDAPTFHVGELL